MDTVKIGKLLKDIGKERGLFALGNAVNLTALVLNQERRKKK